MSRYEFRLPDVGEGISEAELVQAHVKPGDTVEEHDPMLDVMTDKATVTVGAPRSGRVLELRGAVGDLLKVGAVVVVLEVESGDDEGEVEASAVGSLAHELPGGRFFDHGPSGSGEVLATPATRQLARELGVSLDHVRGTGPEGRVVDADVRLAAGKAPATGAQGASAPAPAAPAVHVAGKRVPVRGLRRTLAERMQRAVTTAAHYTFVEECDVTALLALRESLRGDPRAGGTAITLLPLLAVAVARSLAAHPALNRVYDASTAELVEPEAVHLGIATATEAGLVVPVLRDAGAQDVFALARGIEALAEGARAGTLPREALTGSTFTITSLGKQAGYFATPILNLPEVAILGLHRIRKRTVVKDDRIVVGDVALLSLTCDHRFVDGQVGAAFVYDLIERLERPGGLVRPAP